MKKHTFPLLTLCLCMVLIVFLGSAKGVPEPNNGSVQKVAPRMMIKIDEKIEGIEDEHFASNFIIERASERGIRIVEDSSSSSSKRASLLGRHNEAELRKEGVVSDCDYMIQGRVSGKQKPEKGLYGSKDGIRFSLGMNMSVTEVATGTVVAMTTIPSQDILIRNIDSSQAAAREAVQRLMKGEELGVSAENLFKKLEKHWGTEMNSGDIYRMEFVGLDLEYANSLKKSLKSVPGISEIKVRSVDASGISVMECRSLISALDLATYVQKVITGFKLDRSDAHYLLFRSNGQNIQVLKEAAVISAFDSSREGTIITVQSSSWWDQVLSHWIITSLTAFFMGGMAFFKSFKRGSFRTALADSIACFGTSFIRKIKKP